MKVVSLVTQKGGSGKSTLCVSLAVAAQEAGHGVCIVEMDKQATVSQWATARQRKPPAVGQVKVEDLDGAISRLGGAGCDYVFVDTPGVDSPGVNAVIGVSDLCLIRVAQRRPISEASRRRLPRSIARGRPLPSCSTKRRPRASVSATHPKDSRCLACWPRLTS